MKKLYFVIICFCLANNIFSQKLYPLRQIRDSVQLSLTFSKGQYRLQLHGGSDFREKHKNLPVIENLELEEGDLVLRYLAPAADNNISFSFSFFLRDTDGAAIYPPGFEITDAPSAQNSNSRSVRWIDITESVQTDTLYWLHIRRTLMGAVNCEGPRPAFTLRQQLPHYAVGAAGIVMISAGAIYHRQSSDAYDTYHSYWADEKSRADADPFLEQARDRRKDSRLWLYSGLAIVGADAITWGFRWMKVRKKQKMYDLFCAPATSWNIRPAVVPPAPGTPYSDWAANIRFTLNF